MTPFEAAGHCGRSTPLLPAQATTTVFAGSSASARSTMSGAASPSVGPLNEQLMMSASAFSSSALATARSLATPATVVSIRRATMRAPGATDATSPATCVPCPAGGSRWSSPSSSGISASPGPASTGNGTSAIPVSSTATVIPFPSPGSEPGTVFGSPIATGMPSPPQRAGPAMRTWSSEAERGAIELISRTASTRRRSVGAVLAGLVQAQAEPRGDRALRRPRRAHPGGLQRRLDAPVARGAHVDEQPPWKEEHRVAVAPCPADAPLLDLPFDRLVPPAIPRDRVDVLRLDHGAPRCGWTCEMANRARAAVEGSESCGAQKIPSHAGSFGCVA